MNTYAKIMELERRLEALEARPCACTCATPQDAPASVPVPEPAATPKRGRGK